MQDLLTYGNCERCCQGGPVGSECSQCEERPLTKGGEATGTIRPIYRLMQVEDMFLDSRLIAEIYRKGHDVAKADTWHRPGELVEVVNILPFFEIYDRLNGERNGECLSDDKDFSDIAAHVQGS